MGVELDLDESRFVGQLVDVGERSLEELAAGTQLDKATSILEQLETRAQELVKQIDGITVEALHRQAEGMDERRPFALGIRVPAR